MTQVHWVRIAGWQTGRRLIIEDNVIKFEVAGKCNLSCSACPSRINWVANRMRNAGDSVKYHWTSQDPRMECFLVLENCGWKPDEVVSRLSNLLALHISLS